MGGGGKTRRPGVAALDRDVDEQAASTGAHHSAPGFATDVLSLQAQAGNRATTALLQRVTTEPAGVTVLRRKGGGNKKGAGNKSAPAKKPTSELSDLDALVAEIEGAGAPSKAKGKGKGQQQQEPPPKKKTEKQKQHERDQRKLKEKKDEEQRLKDEANKQREAAELAEAKSKYEQAKPGIMDAVTKAKAEAPPFSVDLTKLLALEAEHTTLASAKQKSYSEMSRVLGELRVEAVQVRALAAEEARVDKLRTEGRLGINGIELDKTTVAALKGDGDAGEVAAVQETLDAINGVPGAAWHGGSHNGVPGKWNQHHGNGEQNLPADNYREYYVRPPAAVNGYGGRRIVIGASGRMYYTWTHYGANGKPPFVLIG